jgi:hypothetical protein
VLRNIAFGSFLSARGSATAFTGHVTPGGKAELLVTEGKVTVLAAVGGKAPHGARYRDLRPPVLRGGVHDYYVAFPDY